MLSIEKDMWLGLLWWNDRRRRKSDRESSRSSSRNGRPLEFPSIVLRVRSHSRDGSVGSSDANTTVIATSTGNGAELSQSLPMLYSLAKSWAWQAVLVRCDTHPHEVSAEYVDHRGDNVLHWTVMGRSSDDVQGVVLRLLDLCPALARRPNKLGNLPLHVASSYRVSSDVLIPVLCAYPEAAGIPNGSGSYVLHLLCDYGASAYVLHHVLQTAAGSSSIRMEDPIYRRRPLHILNGRKNLQMCQHTRDTLRTLRRKLRTLQAGGGVVSNESEIDQCEEEIIALTQTNNDLWNKVAVLLVAENTRQPLSANFPTPCEILHAAINIVDCPSSFQEQAILLYSDLLMRPMTTTTTTATSCGSTDRGAVPLHVAADRGDTALLLDLVQACPAAATVRTVRGEFPLSTATRRQPSWGWEDGIGALVHANPAALEELHLPDTLYPRIWSRLSSSRESLFCAIRSFPRLIDRQ